VSAVVVVATIRPLPEHRAEVIAAFEKAIAAVHADDDRLVMIEKWASQDALDAHSRGTALAELGPALAGKTEGRSDIQVLCPRPAGTPEQGTL
jgi:quinol monooxygenase YgiN